MQNAYIAYSTDTPEYAILTALQREPMTTPEVMDAAGVPLYEWLKYLPPLEAAGLVRSERVPADLGTIQRWYLNTQTDR